MLHVSFILSLATLANCVVCRILFPGGEEMLAGDAGVIEKERRG